MKIFRYNFDDIYKVATGYKTRQKGVTQLFHHLYNRDWIKFFKSGRNKILDTTRWCHYIGNVEEMLYSDLSIMDKAIIIKLASYRDYANYELYGDKTIRVERIKDIPIERIERISLVKISNDKLSFTFEEI